MHFKGRVTAIGGQEGNGRLVSFLVVFGDDSFPFKAKMMTIWENNPAGILWRGISIYFGRKILEVKIVEVGKIQKQGAFEVGEVAELF